MADLYAVSGETLTGIADAIRSKTGSDEFLPVASFASAIEGISSGVYTGSIIATQTGQIDIPVPFVPRLAYVADTGRAANSIYSVTGTMDADKVYVAYLCSYGSSDSLYYARNGDYITYDNGILTIKQYSMSYTFKTGRTYNFEIYA